MSYEQYRASLIQSYYDYQLETLMSDFDPRRPTVILLPGGMGSQLERTERAYPANPNLIMETQGRWRSTPPGRTRIPLCSQHTAPSSSSEKIPMAI